MDQPTQNNVPEHEVDAVFEIVKNATVSKRPEVLGTPLQQKLDKLNIGLATYAASGFVVMLVLAMITYFFEEISWGYTLICIYILVVLFLGLINIVMILHSAIFIRRAIKKPYDPFFNRIYNACSFDLKYAKQLLQCDKGAIQFVLMQCKCERDRYKILSGILGGSIERVGLFTALGALVILASKLLEMNFGEDFVRMLPIIIGAFYFMSLYAYTVLGKMDRAIALLEFGVQAHH